MMRATMTGPAWRVPAILLLTVALTIAASQVSPMAAEQGPSPTMDEQFTPVTQSVLSTPRWFKGADDRVHLVYELLLTNAFPVPVTVTSVEVLDADRETTAAVLTGDALTAAMSLLTSGGTPTTDLPPSTIGVVWLDVPFADRNAVPSAVEHRVTVAVPPGLPVPESITAIGGRADVDLRPPVVLGPPLLGPRWVAVGSCCDGPHRRAVQPIDGHLYLSQRFAIDFARLDAEGRLPIGDASLNASTSAYGQPVIAVADATVVAAVDGIPDQTTENPYPITLENGDGNHVILDLGEERFALYAHLRPGTVAVREGQRVRRGELLGELGNTGSSEGAHLHFHVMDRPSALAADGLPYVFNAFDLTGRTPPSAELAELLETQQPIPIDTSDAGPRHDALPLGGDEITFFGNGSEK